MSALSTMSIMSMKNRKEKMKIQNPKLKYNSLSPPILRGNSGELRTTDYGPPSYPKASEGRRTTVSSDLRRATGHGLPSYAKASEGRRATAFSGVALVAVLAVLVVLTILAASFSVMMNLELKQSNEQQNSFQLDILTEAGYEHSKTLLMATSAIGHSGLLKDKFSKWFYVKAMPEKLQADIELRLKTKLEKLILTGQGCQVIPKVMAGTPAK